MIIAYPTVHFNRIDSFEATNLLLWFPQFSVHCNQLKMLASVSSIHLRQLQEIAM